MSDLILIDPISMVLDGGVFAWVAAVLALVSWAWVCWASWSRHWRDWYDLAMAWWALFANIGVLGALMGWAFLFEAVAKAPAAEKQLLLLHGAQVAFYPFVVASGAAVCLLILGVVGQLRARHPLPEQSALARGARTLGALLMASSITLPLAGLLSFWGTFAGVAAGSTLVDAGTISDTLFRTASICLLTLLVVVAYPVLRAVVLVVSRRK